MKAIYPSLISADLLHLGKVIDTFNPICDGFHIDIMDNHFVPNLTWGAAFANAISAASKNPTWVHLMVDNPEAWLPNLKLIPGSTLSFHIENSLDKNRIIQSIRGKKLKPSIAISPKTGVEEILPFAHLVDQILIMSVEPGFSGQNFMPEVMAKIAPLILLRSQKKLHFTIAMDGGIDATNIQMLAHKGVDEFAAAKAIFGQTNPVDAYEALKQLTN